MLLAAAAPLYPFPGASRCLRERNLFDNKTSPVKVTCSHAESAREKIVLVDIQDNDFAKSTENDRSKIVGYDWPPPLRYYNRLLIAIGASHPKAIFFDLILGPHKSECLSGSCKLNIDGPLDCYVPMHVESGKTIAARRNVFACLAVTVRSLTSRGIAVFAAAQAKQDLPDYSNIPNPDDLSANGEWQKILSGVSTVASNTLPDEYPSKSDCSKVYPAWQLSGRCSIRNKDEKQKDSIEQKDDKDENGLILRWGTAPWPDDLRKKVAQPVNECSFPEQSSFPASFDERGGIPPRWKWQTAIGVLARGLWRPDEYGKWLQTSQCTNNWEISAHQAIDLSNKDQHSFDGMYVLIGARNHFVSDSMSSPSNGSLPGTAWHAMALDNLLQLNHPLYRAGKPVDKIIEVMLEICILPYFIKVVGYPHSTRKRRNLAWRSPGFLAKWLICVIGCTSMFVISWALQIYDHPKYIVELLPVYLGFFAYSSRPLFRPHSSLFIFLEELIIFLFCAASMFFAALLLFFMGSLCLMAYGQAPTLFVPFLLLFGGGVVQALRKLVEEWVPDHWRHQSEEAAAKSNSEEPSPD